MKDYYLNLLLYRPKRNDVHAQIKLQVEDNLLIKIDMIPLFKVKFSNKQYYFN